MIKCATVRAGAIGSDVIKRGGAGCITDIDGIDRPLVKRAVLETMRKVEIISRDAS